MSVLCNLRLSHPFISVQRFYGRTTRHTMVVRPDTLTPYVLTPFERTTKHPWTYVHGKFPRKIRDFMPDKRYFRVFEN